MTILKNNPTNLLSRILATALVWSIVLVFARRMEVRMVELILVVLGGALTAVIWAGSAVKERK